ncbi:MAG: thermonuclease family protein [archaeon]
MKAGAVICLAIFIALIFLYNSDYQGFFVKENKEKAVVTNVIDGDTIVISGGERLRLLGIDTPEKGEFYYKESKARMEELIENREITLEKEGDNKDKYGRILRYIFLDDSNINMLLVKEGYAICYFYEESRYQQECIQLEENARAGKIGRWQK